MCQDTNGLQAASIKKYVTGFTYNINCFDFAQCTRGYISAATKFLEI